MRKYKEDIQIESFPGARFQHFTDILTKDRANKKVLKFIICYVGLNDRSLLCENIMSKFNNNDDLDTGKIPDN